MYKIMLIKCITIKEENQQFRTSYQLTKLMFSKSCIINLNIKEKH